MHGNNYKNKGDSSLIAVLSKLVWLIDSFTNACGRVVRWLTLAMVLTMFAIVLLRYGFNIGWIAMQESVLYLHGTVFMLGAAYTLKENAHVRVDIFYHRFSQKAQAWVNIFGSLCLLLPVAIFIFYISFDYVANSWQIMEKSQEAGGLPLVYLAKSLILVMAVSMALQGIAEVLRNLVTLIAPKCQQLKLQQHKELS